MTCRKSLIAIAAVALLSLLPTTATAAAPAWRVSISSHPTNFKPNYSLNEGDLPEYVVGLTNIGSASSSGPVTATVELGDGITEHGTGNQIVTLSLADFGGSPDRVDPAEGAGVQIPVDVGALAVGSTVETTVTVSGGGGGSTQASTTTTISAPSPVFSAPPPFGFLSGADGLSGTVTDPDGGPVSQAGNHPFQAALDFGLPSKQIGTVPGAGELLGVEGGLRDLIMTLPKGLIANPAATPVRCTEAQFEVGGCPDASAVGTVNVTSVILGDAGVGGIPSPLYNMVPAAGEAAQFGLEPLKAGVYIHVSGGLSPGDYALQATSTDLPSFNVVQAYGAGVQLWGDPSSPDFDLGRGECHEGRGNLPPEAVCPVPAQDTPFLSMPSECRSSQVLEAAVASWVNPGVFHRRSTPFTDLNGNTTEVDGCSALDFTPTLIARPTTNVADSASGLSVDLRIPQTDSLDENATPHLKKAVVTLPEGLVLNPASGNGLEGCDSDEVGIDPSTGVPDGDPVACPDASRIGEVEVETPLLGHPLPGSVYVATPHDNPFDSLLAIYIVVDYPSDGILVKLAGHVVPDPETGRLTTVFDESPQLPFDSFKLDFFGGAKAPLRTPATCGTYSTTSQMTPWSAPESGPPATPKDTWSISQGPNGTCATNESALPNSPEFDAGSISPIAAKSTPFVLHLRRNDGTQNFSAVNVSPPPGLTAKLAGTEQCSDAALAVAASKSGREEQRSPSCPSSSEVGSFTAAAGAGPSPYYASGKLYLAGPYKGGPLSFAFITPAVAGPYDLGTVVTKAAVYLDPTTGRVTTVSDPLPEILEGIVLDVRSVDVSLDRPNFSRNGTSCDPLSVEGTLTSTLGQVASLAERFQLGECTRLAFKPKLSIRLFGGTKRGAHPALRGSLRMPERGANIAEASVALPRSEFLDQAHIGTVCTRVQFSEGAGNGANCPAASIYGSAVATSPLVDYALEGNAYLRSSSHELPDLVVALHGPPSQPIAVNVVGRVDSVKGGIRTTFEGVPDLPVSSFVLNMQGGKKGLLQNSTNVCKGKHKATGVFEGQNGDSATLTPALKNGKCGKAKKRKRQSRAARRHRRATR